MKILGGGFELSECILAVLLVSSISAESCAHHFTSFSIIKRLQILHQHPCTPSTSVYLTVYLRSFSKLQDEKPVDIT